MLASLKSIYRYQLATLPGHAWPGLEWECEPYLLEWILILSTSTVPVAGGRDLAVMVELIIDMVVYPSEAWDEGLSPRNA